MFKNKRKNSLQTYFDRLSNLKTRDKDYLKSVPTNVYRIVYRKIRKSYYIDGW